MEDVAPRRRESDRPRGRLRKGMYILPSLFTTANIAAGFYAILQTVHGISGEPWHMDFAAKAIGFAVLFDGLDGRIARMTHTDSDFGRELDSLADVITFGVAPALQRTGQLPGGSKAWPPAASMPTADAIELLADNHVRFLHPSVLIDLGGIAKGFAVDRAIEVLRARGVRSAMVNAGGDLAAFGPEARVIHIRDPRSPDRLMCQIEVSNRALASSARRFDPFRSADTVDTAVIEPKTQMPARAVHGATVCAPSCMVADALTKVVMVAGKRAAAPLARFHASAIFVSTDGDIHTTSDWQGVLQHAA